MTAKKIFDSIAETTKAGIDAKILAFYDYVKKHPDGATLKH